MIIAIFIFITIILSSAWFWDSTKEKMYITETRNDLELVSRNTISVLINTVGDPPNWNNLTFSEQNIYSIGIGKNRAWVIDEEKAKRLSNLNGTHYQDIKKILGVRGPLYEFYLNISKFNLSSSSFTNIALVGKQPNSSAAHIVRVTRFALSDKDDSWIRMKLLVWNSCRGSECY